MNASWESQPMGYSTVETLLEEVSNHMAASNISRHSRGTMGQKTASMRVVKPNSASNSPRNSVGLGRRMTDGAYRRRLAMLEQGTRDAAFASNSGLQPPQQTTRPVSWHPASHVPHTTYPYPHHFPQADNTFQLYDFQPSPATFSGYNSPSSTFSPVSAPAPLTGYEQPQYIPQSRHSYHPPGYVSQQQTSTLPSQPLLQTTTNNMDPTMYSHFDWGNFAMNGFEDPSTTPPTPENFLPIQHPEPTFQTEDAIPYQSLDDSDEGEELIGMGLYDAPEAKSPPSDPHLDNYRALMMSQLLGTPYRRPEPTGKGLKLEETWAPPASDDEEDSDQDGDAEDEELVVRVETNTQQGVSTNIVGGYYVPPQQGLQSFSRDGWL